MSLTDNAEEQLEKRGRTSATTKMDSSILVEFSTEAKCLWQCIYYLFGVYHHFQHIV